MKEKMLSDLVKEVEVYYAHYVYLCDIMSINEHMHELENQKKEKPPNFFEFIEATCIDAMMEFACLFDNDLNTKTIMSLLSKATKSADLFPNKQELQDKINKYKNKIYEDEDISKAISTIKL